MNRNAKKVSNGKNTVRSSGRRVTQEVIDDMAALRHKGFTFAAIGKRLGCSERTARRYAGKVEPRLQVPQANAEPTPEPEPDARTLREGFTAKFLDVLYADKRLRALTVTLEDKPDGHTVYHWGGPPSILFLAEAERLISKRFARMGEVAVRLLARDVQSERRFLREVVGDLYWDYVAWHNFKQGWAPGGTGEDWRPPSERPPEPEVEILDPYGLNDD